MFLSCFFVLGQAVNAVVLKSAITMVGSANTNVANNSYRVLQSVGQSGVIGTAGVNKISVQQGFLNSVLNFKIDNSNNININETFNFNIYPNPFVSYIELNFFKETMHDIHIYVFDLNGKLLINRDFKPSSKIYVPLDNFQVASYVIKVVSGTHTFTKQIIKKD